MPRNAHISIALLALLASCAGPQAPGPAGPAGDAESTAAGETAAPEGTAAPDVVRLADYLQRVEPLGFSGAVIVEHRGEVVLRRGYGLSDREARRPYTPETVQTHGSITKQVTAAAILLLESRGRLTVEDTLGRHLGSVPEDKRGITLHHLLTHSSGLPGSIGPDSEPIGADEFAARALATPLLFEPGSAFEYSNVGYSLLGIVVERVSGRRYERFLRDELFTPAGLVETGYLLPAWKEERLAKGYLDGELWGRVHRREWRDDGPGWNLRANGGLHTTVDDMCRWLRVLRGQGPLPSDAVSRWTAMQVAEEEGSEWGYAYGWEATETPVGPLTAHNGGNGIFSADFLWLPELELFLYIQGNSSVVYAAQMRDMLLGALFEPGFALPPQVSADPGAIPAAARGRTGGYVMEDGTLRLRPDDVRLTAELSGQGALDAALGHGPELRVRLAALNARAGEAMRRLQAGREDAFAGLVRPDEDAAARALRMLERMTRGGGIASVDLVGSIENVAGTRFAEHGPWTTFFRAVREDGEARAWSVLWRDDGTYAGTAIGPTSDFPRFVLVPTGEDAYVAVERDLPWRQLPVSFDRACLQVRDARACR